MSHRSHQQFWRISATATGAVGVVFLGAGLVASPFTWLSVFMIIAYVCGALTVAAFVPGTREWRFPLAKIPPEAQFPILDTTADDDSRQDLRRPRDLNPPSELREALDAAGVRRKRRD